MIRIRVPRVETALHPIPDILEIFPLPNSPELLCDRAPWNVPRHNGHRRLSTDKTARTPGRDWMRSALRPEKERGVLIRNPDLQPAPRRFLFLPNQNREC